MFYLIYKITNIINNKVYIGSHKTKNLNDGYLGSGKIIKRAINKYGKNNFVKEILFVYDNPEDMYKKEQDLVNQQFLIEGKTYNLKIGGYGGWGYVNDNNLSFPKKFKNREDFNRAVSPFIKGHQYGKLGVKKRNELYPNLSSESAIRRNLSGEFGFRGRQHTDETKKLMSGPREKSMGQKNSQYGTMWITDGEKNKKIKKSDLIPDGWKKGRSLQ